MIVLVFRLPLLFKGKEEKDMKEIEIRKKRESLVRLGVCLTGCWKKVALIRRKMAAVSWDAIRPSVCASCLLINSIPKQPFNGSERRMFVFVVNNMKNKQINCRLSS